MERCACREIGIAPGVGGSKPSFYNARNCENCQTNVEYYNGKATTRSRCTGIDEAGREEYELLPRSRYTDNDEAGNEDSDTFSLIDPGPF